MHAAQIVVAMPTPGGGLCSTRNKSSAWPSLTSCSRHSRRIASPTDCISPCGRGQMSIQELGHTLSKAGDIRQSLVGAPARTQAISWALHRGLPTIPPGCIDQSVWNSNSTSLSIKEVSWLCFLPSKGTRRTRTYEANVIARTATSSPATLLSTKAST